MEARVSHPCALRGRDGGGSGWHVVPDWVVVLGLLGVLQPLPDHYDRSLFLVFFMLLIWVWIITWLLCYLWVCLVLFLLLIA